ncbi:MAG: adenylate/guanylate cyclase domain-containing protein [Spirulinaceae cyanobacterium]
MIGKTPRIFQGKNTDKKVLETMRQRLCEGKPFSGELVNYTKDGQEYVLELMVDPVHNQNGRITHFVSIQRDITEHKEAEKKLREEQEKSERLLLNILPEAIAQRLKQQPGTIADGFSEATVMFADLVNFTQLATQMSPQKLVGMLNSIFSAFDELTEQYGLEKIKTIGDSYMVVAGVPLARRDHAEAMAGLALEMQEKLTQFNEQQGTNLNLHIGINSGPVVAGVIGKKKFIYDLWGDTVNTASRMESHGVNGGIQLSEVTYQLLQSKYNCEKRGSIVVKGKGEMTTYLLLDHRVEQLALASSI